jgi:hypothetical protein
MSVRKANVNSLVGLTAGTGCCVQAERISNEAMKRFLMKRMGLYFEF